MSTYNLNIDTVNTSLDYYQAEKHIYGSSRLGMLKDSVNVLGSAYGNTDSLNVTHKLGNKRYELSNHLGNVLTVISDKPIPHNNGGTVDYFMADIKSAQDYSPFGVTLSGRDFNSAESRYGFQNQEVDNEIKGKGNSVNFKYRMHDPRLGRFFAVDPLSATYPYNSPYAFSENTVLNAIELEGLEKVFVYNKWTDGKSIVHTKYSHTYIDNDLKENLNRVNHYNSQGEIEKSQFKSGRKSGTTSVTYSKDDNKSLDIYVMFESTTDAKKSRNQQNTESFVASEMSKDVTHYDRLEGAKGYENGGKQLLFGTVAILTAPVALAGATTYGAISTTISLAMSVDDIGGLMVENDSKGNYQSLTQSFFKSEQAKANVAGVKGGLGLLTLGYNSTSSIMSITKPSTLKGATNAAAVTTDAVQAPSNVKAIKNAVDKK